MENVLKYKGYVGTVEYSTPDEILFGRVLGIKDSISYEGKTVVDLKEDFQNGIDHYMEVCEKTGKEPEKPFSGKFVVRIPPNVHRDIALKAKKENISINTFVTKVLNQEAQSDS
ncbi:type II toxin-antitoxin system HicB family antitoxin [bacterium]|nr:type II toxin-antitoxin system HicB family antitoxin [bacterium]